MLLIFGGVLGLFILVDGVYVWRISPDWAALEAGPPPESNFIHRYRKQLGSNQRLPASQWQPVPISRVPDYVQRAFVVAEDGRFYQHNGIDFQAIKYAMQENWRLKKLRYGASTISQQTVKNLALNSDRTWLRKWHELVLTLIMEIRLSKQRILELYLNIAQLGPGIFGVQAASEAYWGKSVEGLTIRQAAELAACLPSPTAANPASPAPAFRRRAERIYKNLLIVLGKGE